MDNNSVNIGNKKKTLTVAIVLSVVALLVLGAGFYLFSSSKTVMLQSIGKMNTNIKKLVKDLRNEKLEKLLKNNNLNVELKADATYAGQNLLSFDVNYGLDKKDNLNALFLNIMSSNQPIIDLKTVLKDNKLFFNINEALGYLYQEFDESLINTNSSSYLDDIDYEKVLDYIFKSVKKEINVKEIKKDKETIKVDGKDKKVNKITYEFNKENIINILKNTIDNILDDIDYSSDSQKQEIKNSLYLYVEQLNSMDINSLYYSVYYYGFNNVVMVDFSRNGSTFKFYFKGDTKEITLLTDDEEIFTINIEKDKDTYNLSGKFGELEFNGTYKNKKLDINLESSGLIINLKYEDDSKFVSDDEYTDEEKLKITILGQEIVFNSKLIINDNKLDNIPNLDNAKDLNSLSQEELYILMNSLSGLLNISVNSNSLLGNANNAL